MLTQEEYNALLQQILELTNLDENVTNVVEQLKNSYPVTETEDATNPLQAELEQALAEKEEIKQKYIARFFGGSTGEETEETEETESTEPNNYDDMGADDLDSAFAKLLKTESEE